VDKYPKSKNIANAVYAQAECFMSLDQKAEAQVFFKDVIQRFPRAKEATLAKQRLKSL
jgi:TolA-binding protein